MNHNSLPKGTGSGFAVVLLVLSLLAVPSFAHEGHNEAFTQKQSTTTTTKKVEVSVEGQKAISLKVQAVRMGALDKILKATGRVEPAQNQAYDINPAVQGLVSEVYVSQGDNVVKAQTLATIHSPEIAQVLSQLLQEKARLQAEIATTRSQAQRDIAVQGKQVEITRTNYKREDTLFKEGISAYKDFLEAKSAYETAQVELSSTKRQAALQVQLLQKQLSLTVGAIRSQLVAMGMSPAIINRAMATNSISSKIPIVSPVSGTITFRDITPGENVDTDKKLFSIVSLSPVWVVLDIYQNQINQIYLGQVVRLKTSSNVFISGKISSIGTVVDSSTRTIPVRIVSDNSGNILKPGMAVNAEIILGKQVGTSIILPTAAVIDDNGKSVVYVKTGTTSFQPVNVSVGQGAIGQAEILSGLYEGDQVVVQGAKQIHAQTLLVNASGSANEELSNTVVTKNDKNDWLPIWLGIAIGLALAVLVMLVQSGRIRFKRR